MQISRAPTLDTALNSTGFTIWRLLTQPGARPGNPLQPQLPSAVLSEQTPFADVTT
jgi:hypothetical protein